MDPCGTPTLTGNHSNVWPFSRESETPTGLSLNISPSCQTLSTTLDISRNAPPVSRGGYASKALYKLYLIDKS